MKEFKIWERKIIFSEQECNYNKVISEEQEQNGELLRDVKNALYDVNKDAGNSIYFRIIDNFAEKCCSFYSSKLKDFNVKNAQLNSLINCKNRIKEKMQYQDILSTLDKERKKAYADSEKDKKNRKLKNDLKSGGWVGGGTTIKGAIKADIEASMLNATSKGVHSIMTATGNFVSDNVFLRMELNSVNMKAADAIMKKLEYYLTELYSNYFSLLVKYHVIPDYGKFINENDYCQKQRVLKFKKKIENADIVESELLDEWIKLIKKYPYERNQYKIALENFECAEFELKDMMEFFHISISQLKEEIVDEIKNNINFNNSEELKARLNRIIKIEKLWSIEYNASVKGKIQEEIYYIQQRQYKVSDIEFDVSKREFTDGKSIHFSTIEEAKEARKQAEEFKRKFFELQSIVYDKLKDINIKEFEERYYSQQRKDIFDEYKKNLDTAKQLKKELQQISDKYRIGKNPMDNIQRSIEYREDMLEKITGIMEEEGDSGEQLDKIMKCNEIINQKCTVKDNILQEICLYELISDSMLLTEKAKEKMDSIKQNIIYNSQRNYEKEKESYIPDFRKWLIITIIVGIIVLPLFPKATTLGKVICIIVICIPGSMANENKEQMDKIEEQYQKQIERNKYVELEIQGSDIVNINWKKEVLNTSFKNYIKNNIINNK